MEENKNEEPIVEETKKESILTKKKEVKGKPLKIWIIVMIIVFMLFTFGIGVYFGKEIFSEKEKETNNEQTPIEEKKEENKEEIPNNLEPEKQKEEIPNLEFAKISCGGTDFSFKKSTLNVSDISTKDKLGMLAPALLKKIKSEKLSNIKADVETEIDIDIIEVEKKYFDVTKEMEDQMANGFGTDFYIFSYKNNKSYLKIIIGGCIGPRNEGEYTKFKESKNENNILIDSYYYYYMKNSDVVEKDDQEYFPEIYYKSKGDINPIYKDVLSQDDIDFDVFDTYDLYFDTTNGNKKLIKIVYNAK